MTEHHDRIAWFYLCESIDKDSLIVAHQSTDRYTNRQSEILHWLFGNLRSFCSHKPAYCPSPYSCRGRQQHYRPTQAFSQQIKPFPPILHIPLSQSPQKPLTSSKKPSLHQTQQPPKTHRPTRLKHPPTSTKTQPFMASKVGQIPRFCKAREQSQVHLSSDLARKGAIK